PDVALSKILRAGDHTPFAAVVATDDSTVELASLAARHFGLPHNPPEAAKLSRRKDLARQRQLDAGIQIPEFYRICLHQQLAAQVPCGIYPAVLKPLALSGSRGVMRVDNAVELEVAGERLRTILAAEAPSEPEERNWALVERFIPGREVAVEGMLNGGELNVLSIFDKPDPLDGPFFEETYYITPSRLEHDLQSQMVTCVESVCSAYGLTEGPVHAELRVGPHGVMPLEVAARTIGGDCARLLQFDGDAGLEDAVLCQATGLPVPALAMDGAGGVLMIPTPSAGVLRRVEGVIAAQAVPLIEDVVISARPGNELVPLPEGASYLGFIYARGPNAAAVEAALRAAHACLKIVVAPAWRIHTAIPT
ncbi:MAG: ATP-grasp domain-containing protein, partial [Chromatiales bacterium]|nr:ATP-grasp domain-containing protein [Chromatiales bacterium]